MTDKKIIGSLKRVHGVSESQLNDCIKKTTVKHKLTTSQLLPILTRFSLAVYSQDILIGNYDILNVSIKLYLTVEIYDDISVVNSGYRGPGVYLHIDLPKNYPLTDVGLDEDIKSEGMFYAILTIQTSNSKNWISKYVPKEYTVNADHKIVLREFYVMIKDLNIKTIREENEMIKGIGKKALCLSFPYIINWFKIDPKTSPVILTANGEEGLVKYYENALGFKRFATIQQNTVMATFLDILMRHCGMS